MGRVDELLHQPPQELSNGVRLMLLPCKPAILPAQTQGDHTESVAPFPKDVNLHSLTVHPNNALSNLVGAGSVANSTGPAPAQCLIGSQKTGCRGFTIEDDCHEEVGGGIKE